MFKNDLDKYTAPLREFIHGLLREKSISETYPQDAEIEATTFKDQILPQDEINRKNLCHLRFVTIDDPNSKDFDDAVCCEQLSAGQWRLLVSIADVSTYVKLGSYIDREAARRGSSIYFADTSIPMLPEHLNSEICSLKPNVKRLCLTCEMIISASGKVISYDFYPSIIISAARITYQEAENIIKNHKSSSVFPELYNLYILYQLMHDFRNTSDDFLQISDSEYRLVTNNDGTLKEIIPPQNEASRFMIEEFMVAANKAAAEFINSFKIPMIYRIQKSPLNEKITSLNTMLSTLGLRAGTSRREIKAFLEQIKTRNGQKSFEQLLMRNMTKAEYSTYNEGHFLLGIGSYTHFTSPIRRYTDLVIHRIIKHCICIKSEQEAEKLRQQYVNSNINTSSDNKGFLSKIFDLFHKKTEQKIEEIPLPTINIYHNIGEHLYTQSELSSIAEFCSKAEITAREVSRNINKWILLKDLSSKIGQRFDATVTDIESYGLFVTTDNLGVDGFVYIGSLGFERFSLYTTNMTLRGNSTGRTYYVGQRVTVQLVGVELDKIRISFRIVD